ncbi:hypothetical protein BaRGS_00004706, partial [Batillaria attramentaria]
MLPVLPTATKTSRNLAETEARTRSPPSTNQESERGASTSLHRQCQLEQFVCPLATMDISLGILTIILTANLYVCAAEAQDPIKLEESEEGIDLVLPNYLTTAWPIDAGLALILESLERLEAENTQMKRTLSDVTQQLQETRAAVEDLEQQVTPDRAAFCPRLCDDSIKASESRLRTQVNQLEDEVESLRTQQTLLTHQAEITLTVVDAVQEFQDEYINITDRLNLVEERQSDLLEAMVLAGLGQGLDTTTASPP